MSDNQNNHPQEETKKEDNPWATIGYEWLILDKEANLICAMQYNNSTT